MFPLQEIELPATFQHDVSVYKSFTAPFSPAVTLDGTIWENTGII